MPETVVSPRDCALAVCVPLTAPTFFADIERADAEFARHVLLETGLNPDSAWAEVYQPKVVTPLVRAMKRVSALGVTVLPAATLSELASLFEQFRVVTVFAHCRFPGFTAGDILDAEACVRAIAAGTSIVTRQLRRLVAPSRALPTTETLASVFAAAMEPARQRYATLAGGAEVGPRAGPFIDRLMIELACADGVRAGDYIELRDGLVGFHPLLTTIPPDFDGVIDLTTCNSVILAEPLKMARGSCLVIENERPATAEFRLARYVLAQRLLSMERQRYTDAVMRVHRTIMEAC